MPDPITMAAVLAAGKKQGPKAAAAVYKRAVPKDWAYRLGKQAFDGQQRPKPIRALSLALRNGGLLEMITADLIAGHTRPSRELFVAVNRGLRRDPRWSRRLTRAQRSQRSAAIAGNLLNSFLGALDPAAAVSVSHQANQARHVELVRKIDERQGLEQAAILALDADRGDETP